mgnify:FL=1
MFIVFRFNEDNELIFEDLLFWNIPDKDLEEVHKVWQRTVDVLNRGVRFHRVGKRTYNDLPKIKDNPVSHVRPHARDSKDTLQLPDGRWMPKQCFWLNNTYVKEQIEKTKASSNDKRE